MIFGQSKSTTISGFVYDQSNGEAIIGANVYIEGSPIGSATNLNGYYVIPEVPLDEHILISEYLGYKTEKRKIQINKCENLKLNITMREDIRM